MPSQRNSEPAVKRSSPVSGSWPTSASNSPRPVAIVARTTVPRVITTIVDRPHTSRSRSSGGPNARIARVINGTSAISTTMPKVEPSADENAAQPMAVLACPCSAIG